MPVPAFFDSPDPRIHMDNPNLFMDIGLVEGNHMSVQIVLDLNHLAEANLITKATTIGANMAKPENAALVTGSPFTGAEVTTLMGTFSGKRQDGINLVQAKKTNTSQKNTAQSDLETALTLVKKFLEAKPNLTIAEAMAL